jgi:hypothetical protein
MRRRPRLDQAPDGRRAASRGIRVRVRAGIRRVMRAGGRRVVSNRAMRVDGHRVISNRAMRVDGRRVVSSRAMRVDGRRVVSNRAMRVDGHREVSNRAMRVAGHRVVSSRVMRADVRRAVSQAASRTAAAIVPKVGHHTAGAAVEMLAEAEAAHPEAGTVEEAGAPTPAEAAAHQRDPGGLLPEAHIDYDYIGAIKLSGLRVR